MDTKPSNNMKVKDGDRDKSLKKKRLAEDEYLTESRIMLRLMDVQNEQALNNEPFPDTGNKGIPKTDKIFTTAIKKELTKMSALGKPKEQSPKEEKSPIGQASFVGPKCKGSLKQAFMEKQPWSYKVDIFNNMDKK